MSVKAVNPPLVMRSFVLHTGGEGTDVGVEAGVPESVLITDLGAVDELEDRTVNAGKLDRGVVVALEEGDGLEACSWGDDEDVGWSESGLLEVSNVNVNMIGGAVVVALGGHGT